MHLCTFSPGFNRWCATSWDMVYRVECIPVARSVAAPVSEHAVRTYCSVWELFEVDTLSCWNSLSVSKRAEATFPSTRETKSFVGLSNDMNVHSKGLP